MSKADRSSLKKAARWLDYWAKTVKESAIIGVIGHPKFGKFPKTPDGKQDKQDFEAMTRLAKELRRMSKAA